MDPERVLGALLGKTAERANRRTNLLISHLLDTAAVGELIWDRFLAPATRLMLDRVAGGTGRGRTLLTWLCGVHDLGKATPAFQGRFRELRSELQASGLRCPPTAPRAQYHHTRAGARVIRRQLSGAGWPDEHTEWVWPLIAGHHGSVPSAHVLRPPSSSLKRLAGDATWEWAQDVVMDRLVAEVGAQSLAALAPVQVPSRAFQLQLSGLIMMADWIASTRTLVGLDTLSQVSFPSARERAARLWDGYGLRGGWRSLDVPGQGAFERRFGHSPRPIQVAAQQAAADMGEPGLLLIEAPTGEGKTWAYLMAAELLAARFGMDGVFVGLPQFALGDPTFGVVRKWLGGVDADLVPYVGLLNGNRNFEPQWTAWRRAGGEERAGTYGECGTDEDEQSEPGASEGGGPVPEPGQWFFGGNRGLLCPFVVAPMEELLRAAVRTSVVAVRMAGLMGKVVVLDEAHALDFHESPLLLEAVRWLAMAGVPVVVSSATLSAAQRRDLTESYLAGAAMARGHPVEPTCTNLDGLPTAAAGGPAATAVWQEPDGDRPRIVVHSCRVRRPDLPVSVEILPEPSPLSSSAVSDPARTMDAGSAMASATADRVIRELPTAGRVLVVVDTVARAQALVAEFRGRWDGDVVLLHEWLTAGERTARATACLRALAPRGIGGVEPTSSGLVVVATGDVAGQAFDVDVDLLVTDLAPIDLLLQRIGRLDRGDLTREKAAPPPRVIVTGMAPADGHTLIDAGSVPHFLPESEDRYGRRLLLLAAAQVVAAVRSGRAWQVPADVPALVAAGYDDSNDAVPPAWHSTVQAAAREWSHITLRRLEGAQRRVLSRRGDTGQSLAGLHYLAVSAGKDDADLRALVQGFRGTTEVVVLHHSAGTYRTVTGIVVDSAPTPYTDELIDALLASSLDVPSGWEGLTTLGELGLVAAKDERMSRIRVLALEAAGVTTVCGRRLRYDRALGLVELPPCP